MPVENGGEGVREVLAGDFALVLCDLMMPALSGDVFYRAVERIRPDLCERFVFMTGHRSDAKTDGFLEKVNCLVLRKPFPLQHLRDVMALREVRCVFQSVFEGTASDVGIGPAANVLLTGGIPHSGGISIAAKVAAVLARAQSVPARMM